MTSSLGRGSSHRAVRPPVKGDCADFYSACRNVGFRGMLSTSMRRTFPILIIIIGQGVLGCARGGAGDQPETVDASLGDGGSRDSGASHDADHFDSRIAPVDGATVSDANTGTDTGIGRIDGGLAVTDSGAPIVDAGTRDAGGTVSPDLDPSLSVPPASNPTCSTPNTGCAAGGTWCRLYSSTEGRCEGCVGCGNQNDSCVTGADCNIFLVCYTGRCTLMCELGSTTCGSVDRCLDVGHPTQGVCLPRP